MDEVTDAQKLDRIFDALADDVDNMSDKELMAELKDAGEDTDAIVARITDIISRAVAEHQTPKLVTVDGQRV